MNTLETLAKLDTKIGRYGQRWIQIESGYPTIGVKTARRLEKKQDGPQWVHKERTPTRSSILRLQRLLHQHESLTAVFIDRDNILIEFNPGDYPVHEVTQ